MCQTTANPPVVATWARSRRVGATQSRPISSTISLPVWTVESWEDANHTSSTRSSSVISPRSCAGSPYPVNKSRVLRRQFSDNQFKLNVPSTKENKELKTIDNTIKENTSNVGYQHEATTKTCCLNFPTNHNRLERKKKTMNKSPYLRLRLALYLILKEDNVRFILLALVILSYMVVGAAIFQALESDYEMGQIKGFNTSFSNAYSKLEDNVRLGTVTRKDINELLYMWGNATAMGLLEEKRKWDYAGSFHFVYTVVSTIGFGYESPKTYQAKFFCIFYGLIGCSSGILFFNLFLERIITLLAYFMRFNYERQQRNISESLDGRSDSPNSAHQESWRPSVHWVLFYLAIASVLVGAIASYVYMQVEEWTYLNSLYYCFVTFSTIGFGDMVSGQRAAVFYGDHVFWYRFGNFCLMVLGCCCLYSLFNVGSIVIKQMLNWIIRKLAFCCGQPSNNQSHIEKVIASRIASANRLGNEVGSVYDGGATFSNSKNSISGFASYKGTDESQNWKSPMPPHKHGSSSNFTDEVGGVAIATSKLFDEDT